jgi:hypothetical protein
MHKNLKRMRQNGQPTLGVNRGNGSRQRLIRRDRFGHPQPQDVPALAGNLHPRHNIKWIVMPVMIGPQTGLQAIMVGDSDDVQTALFSNVVQQFVDCGKTIADSGVHVQIGQAGQVHGLFSSLPILTSCAPPYTCQLKFTCLVG